MSRNRVIGRDNTLPWRLPNDMKHFMNTTRGKPVLMGRKTFESMKSPLPGRTNIVLTTDRQWVREGVRVVHDFEAGIALAEQQALIDGRDELMVIGGANVYALALPQATRLYITYVDADIEGDVYFPEFDLSQWQCVHEEAHPADERHSAPFRLTTFERV